MPDALGEERWAAIRAICEGALPTVERVAEAAGVYVKTISRRASAERWEKLDLRRPRVRTAQKAMIDIARRAAAGEELDPVDGEEEAARFGAAEPVAAIEPWPDEPAAARIARIGAVLTRHTEAILRRVEVGQPLEGRQVAALGNLVTLCERIATLAREEMKKEEVDKEEKMREALETINRRIIYLAQCQAREIAMQVFGIAREEVDARLPQPVDRSRKRQKAAAARNGH